MNRYDCAQKGKAVPATAVCRHCGAAVCAEHSGSLTGPGPHHLPHLGGRQ
ncbi:DUF2180 family protein [Streptomyces filamentosus]